MRAWQPRLHVSLIHGALPDAGTDDRIGGRALGFGPGALAPPGLAGLPGSGRSADAPPPPLAWTSAAMDGVLFAFPLPTVVGRQWPGPDPARSAVLPGRRALRNGQPLADACAGRGGSHRNWGPDRRRIHRGSSTAANDPVASSPSPTGAVSQAQCSPSKSAVPPLAEHAEQSSTGMDLRHGCGGLKFGSPTGEPRPRISTLRTSLTKVLAVLQTSLPIRIGADLHRPPPTPSVSSLDGSSRPPVRRRTARRSGHPQSLRPAAPSTAIGGGRSDPFGVPSGHDTPYQPGISSWNTTGGSHASSASQCWALWWPHHYSEIRAGTPGTAAPLVAVHPGTPALRLLTVRGLVPASPLVWGSSSCLLVLPDTQR